ncbi:MAG: hypothetical protein KBD60_12270 [Sterolibacterium sp.]|nr:hypothetical protein [Sterolibacterium sp.]
MSLLHTRFRRLSVPDRVTGLAALRIGVLLVLLLVAQFGAYLHWLGHFSATHEGGPAPERVCSVCLAYAQGSAAHPAPALAVLPLPVCLAEEVAALFLPIRSRVFFAYLSQAPPVFS